MPPAQSLQMIVKLLLYVGLWELQSGIQRLKPQSGIQVLKPQSGYHVTGATIRDSGTGPTTGEIPELIGWLALTVVVGRRSTIVDPASVALVS